MLPTAIRPVLGSLLTAVGVPEWSNVGRTEAMLQFQHLAFDPRILIARHRHQASVPEESLMPSPVPSLVGVVRPTVGEPPVTGSSRIFRSD